MIVNAVKKLVVGTNLSREECYGAMDDIMGGRATPAQIASFITALRIKGETVEEIAACAQVMRDRVVRVHVEAEDLVDTCGTGGDGARTFNISTTAAFVVAGAGITVAKHGNRSVSSQSGSADLFAALGVNIQAGIPVVERCLREVGIGFLFAPLLHGAMKHAIGPRQEIGIRTVFNILGPLTNPAGAPNQVIGVYDPELTETLCQVLRELGSRRAYVVHGCDGLDEITLTGTTRVSELKNNRIWTFNLDPAEFGFRYCRPEDLKGGDAETNAKITLSILNGEPGPKRDVILLNAAAAIYVAGRSKSLKEGLAAAADSIESGRAMNKLEALKRVSSEGA
ncbi:MAG: anthranilate phosphoribosyltransferase [Nitrospirae bacterium CG_4_9_14_3_um_filter_53_35]|nr:MAG: anthranilate phosphoribosyltransferase [Nitrospirae bacterium CG17_big_fil_post_rev_8_21_14_2_50_50_9]PJA75963.1 MAG: anthranilate phosphoribosyltransferase [Nitrospirae bacterium CG_4_9_14_3_um_filter_53_35]